MSATSPLEALREVRAAITADRHGNILRGTTAAAPLPVESAAATATAVAELSAAGRVLGLTGLQMVLVSGRASRIVTAVRDRALLRVVVDASASTSRVEELLHAWVPPADEPPPVPRRAAAANPAVAPAARAEDWAALRRSLVRGRLSEAAGRARTIAHAQELGAGDGAPPPATKQLETLLDGVGRILAGDPLGGARLIDGLAADSRQEPTVRWLSLYWTARAALDAGALPQARGRIKDVLAAGQQIDAGAIAASMLVGAEILAHHDCARALVWLRDSRTRFAATSETWGVARTWLAEARVLATNGLDQESAQAASRAAAADPAWDEPAVFLARRALMRGEVADAEILLAHFETVAAHAVQCVIDAIRHELVTPVDASELLRVQERPPSDDAVAVLERIATASPRFLQAREALAWVLLRLGRYAAAEGVFRALLDEPLSSADRSSVALGIRCAAIDGDAGAREDAPSADAGPRPLPGADGSSATFSGQLSVFAFPDLLELLRTGRRTGILVCSGRGIATLRLQDGTITSASSPATPSLGNLLVSARAISPVALREVVDAQRTDETDQLIGELLVQKGLVDADAVCQALTRQIHLVVGELVNWNHGQFAFTCDDREPAKSPVTVRIDPQRLLLEIFTKLDEDRRGAATIAGGAEDRL